MIEKLYPHFNPIELEKVVVGSHINHTKLILIKERKRLYEINLL